MQIQNRVLGVIIGTTPSEWLRATLMMLTILTSVLGAAGCNDSNDSDSSDSRSDRSQDPGQDPGPGHGPEMDGDHRGMNGMNGDDRP